MRALAVHPDVLVVVSRVWQTTAALVRAPADGTAGRDDDATTALAGGGPAANAREAFLVDSPIYPDELELTAQIARQAGFAVAGLLATHADWDHLLGRLAFPDAALGVAETTGARLTARPGDPARELRSFDADHYVQRDKGLGMGELQTLPVPGRIDLGAGEAPGVRHELELHPADGHTADGMAIWVPWARVLLCGDYLSPVEIPTWHEADGSRTGYRATLDRLRPLVEQADWVVPGHGGPIDAQRAMAIWREDVAYVERGTMPIARNDRRQKALDRANHAVE